MFILEIASVSGETVMYFHICVKLSYVGVGMAIESIDSIIDSLSSNVYISIDLDVLDPSIMSAVGTPEPGGMGWWEILHLLRSVSEQKNIVGFDVMELAPNEGPTACAYTAAKLVYKMIGYSSQKMRRNPTGNLLAN